MKIAKKQVLILLFICSTLCLHSIVAKAQISFQRYDSIAVKTNGSFIDNAWAGGINYGQFSDIDLNLDGIKDLIIFDRTGNKIMPFINLGLNHQVSYRYAPEYRSKFPKLHDWVLLADYNCDGREDIFSYSTGGFSVYTNTSNPLTGLQFQLSVYIVKSHYSSFPNDYLNLYVSRVDIPAIEDIDRDGDLDVLTFDINSGSEIEFHKNMSIEDYGSCDSLNNFVKNAACWGNFTANTTNTVNLNIACKMQPRYGIIPEEKNEKNLHVGSSSLAIDIDNDRDFDLLMGGVSTNDLNLIKNGGDTSAANMISQEINFPIADTPVNITIFPAAFQLDVNNDGQKDLICAPNAGNSSENFNGVWFYKNIDTTGACNFAFQNNSFMQDQMIETGEGAYPAFFDYNADGLLDIIIGNYGYFNVGGSMTSKLSLYKNIGNAQNPSYELITRDYAGISALNLSNVRPTFGDTDNDGDIDMLIATNNAGGSILYFQNIAGIGNVANFQLSNPSLISALGQFTAPQLVDVNRDGRLDLIVGLRNGSIAYYQNTSTGPLQMTLNTSNFGNVNVCSYGAFIGYCSPQLIDEAGTFRLYAGNQDGHIYFYDSINNNLNGSFVLRDSIFLGLDEGDRIAPAFTDVNADGYLDCIIGNYSGGLSFFKGKNSNISVVENHATPHQLNLYPNPVSGLLHIQCTTIDAGQKALLEIYSSLGQLMYRNNKYTGKEQIETTYWQKGIYYCKIQSNTTLILKKFVRN